MNSIYKLCDDIMVRLTTNWAARMFALFLVLMMGLFFGLGKLSSPEPSTVQVTLKQLDNVASRLEEVQSTPLTPVSLMDITNYHAALARASHIDQSCYDEKNRLWLIHSYNSEENTWPEGWYYSSHDDIETMFIGNGTISITNMDSVFNDEIYPDVSGLNCTMHTPSS